MGHKTSLFSPETNGARHGDVDIAGKSFDLFRSVIDVVKEDAWITEVRKSTELPERHFELAMAPRDIRKRRIQRIDLRGVHFPEKFHRQVPVVRRHPAPRWIADRKIVDRGLNGIPRFERE